MVIINPTISTQPAALTRPAGPAPVLPADRVLNAVVLGERAQHLYELSSGSLRMMAESQTPLREGEQLQLRVLGKDAQQRPQLEILQRGTQDISPQLRNRLPEQLSLNHVHFHRHLLPGLLVFLDGLPLLPEPFCVHLLLYISGRARSRR